MAQLSPRLAAFAASLALLAAPACGEDAPACKLCLAAQPSPEDVPLRIEIEGGMEFSRLALSGKGDGSALLDPQSGAKRVDQGLIDLGGYAVTGRARISGAPSRSVRIVLPPSVTMRTPDGGTAELTDLATDLPAMPMLDAGGSLEFAFGGRLRVSGTGAGTLRGRIAISVEYD
jgi:hypothetical protein